MSKNSHVNKPRRKGNFTGHPGLLKIKSDMPNALPGKNIHNNECVSYSFNSFSTDQSENLH